jgi:hypothetical protein
VVHGGKHGVAVLEVEQADDLALLVEVGEEVLAGRVGGDAGRQDDAGAAGGVEQAADGFGKDGVSVDVAAGGQRATGAVAEVFAGAVGGMDGGDELGEERGVLLQEFLVEFGAGGRVGRGGVLPVAGGEEFLFLEFDAFPGKLKGNLIISINLTVILTGKPKNVYRKIMGASLLNLLMIYQDASKSVNTKNTKTNKRNSCLLI